ncbi:MAG: diguanylate cyclase [Candidatus Omnitrophica bacterium]|nr:diguanylate cyclase [Candidatus Omnitrophota bacterium]MCM8831585.1 diguanylate cyclase [Candidatus Omnitrophota bacterium]
MKKNSIFLLSLKRKLFIAFSLITLLPLAVLINYFYGTFTNFNLVLKIILIFIIFLGWYIIFEISYSVIKIYTTTKKTMKNLGEPLPTITNEVESLEKIMNMLAFKVKDGFGKLTELSQKTEELNREVSRKVSVLSTILQANDFVSKGASVQDVIQFLVQRLQEILSIKICCCCVKVNSKKYLEPFVCIGIDALTIEKLMQNISDYLLSLSEIVTLNVSSLNNFLGNWAKDLNLQTIIISPLYAKESSLGVLFFATYQEDFSLSEDDINILNLFSKNIAIILEHQKLLKRVQDLEIIDYLTGLYNDKYIAKRLDEEINRAVIYRRPCGFILLEIKNYEQFQKEYGVIEAEKLLKKIVNLMKEEVRPIDIMGRLSTNIFAVILIEKNKRQSQEVANKIKEKLDLFFGNRFEIASAASETPVDGISADQLISFARSQLKALQ